MAYGNNTARNNNQAGYGNKNTGGARGVAPAAAGQEQQEREEPILAKFMRATKSGKSVSFLTGEKAITIPANTRVVVTPISDKRKAALEKSAQEKGFTGSTPTHELVVFPVEIKQAK